MLTTRLCFQLSIFMFCETNICYFANYTPTPPPAPQSTPPFGFPPTYSKTIEKNQKNQKNQRCLPQTMQKPSRKTKKTKKTKDFANYRVKSTQIQFHADPRGWNLIVCEIFGFLGFFGFPRGFLLGLGRASLVFWVFLVFLEGFGFLWDDPRNHPRPAVTRLA